MGRIVVVGGLNMDLHLFGLRQPSAQGPQVADRHLAQPGGKGANVARAATRLGADVLLVGRVGDDEFGRDCIDAVAADGVDVAGVSVSVGRSTGFVAIGLTEGKHRSLVFSPGANALLTWADVSPHVATLGPGDLLIAQAEIPTDALSDLAVEATRRGVPLFLDPTPPDQVLRTHITAAEVITPDLAEAAQLTGREGGSRLWPYLAARELVELGARRAIVKTGESGAVFADGTGVFEVPTVAVDVVDETGAGDVFLAALAVRRQEGAGWDESTRFANAASALSVAGAGLALPDRAAVDRAVVGLDGGWRRVLEPSGR